MLLYIHIPFCASKCGYCGFNSRTNMLNFKQKYLDALCLDLKNEMEQNCHFEQSESEAKNLKNDSSLRVSEANAAIYELKFGLPRLDCVKSRNDIVTPSLANFIPHPKSLPQGEGLVVNPPSLAEGLSKNSPPPLRRGIKGVGKIPKFHSIYIGGGTPNTLNPSDYEQIFRILEPKIAPNTEITMELNPNVSPTATLRAFKDLGVNRFSIGAQSFCDDKLKLLERTHSPKIARKFIESALKCGVKTSIDLIYDTILDSPKRVRFELESALNLGVGHISCYTLSIDKNSAFFANGKNPTCESSLCYELKAILEQNGFTQYEVSNFARDDLQKSRHNLGYWAYCDYIGVGLGAVGKRADLNSQGDLQVARIYKQSDFGAYLANPLSVRCEILSQSDIRLEKIFLGFRSEVGVNPALIANQNRLKILLDSDKIRAKNGKIYATNYFIADEMALFLG